MGVQLTSPLDLPVNPITKRVSEYISISESRGKETRKLSRPLFDAGISMLCLAKIPKYAMTDANYQTYHRFSLIVQGQMTIRINSSTFTAGPGAMVMTPAGSITQRRAHGKIEWLYIDIADVPAWKPLRNCVEYTRPYESAAHLYILTRGILDGVQIRDPFSMRCVLEYSQMVLTLLRRELSMPARTIDTRCKELAGLFERIHKEPGKEWTRATMAQEVCMTERQLNRTFRAYYAQSPIQMLNFIRMSYAAELLVNTDKTIAAIAEEVGYNSHFALTRAFKKIMGSSPNEYRKSLGRDPFGD